MGILKNPLSDVIPPLMILLSSFNTTTEQNSRLLPPSLFFTWPVRSYVCCAFKDVVTNIIIAINNNLIKLFIS